jgi:hypothetical protein
MQVRFGKYNFNIKEEGNQQLIFDPLRKRFVALTPEEWVRQHWIYYLIEDCHYPKGLLASEITLDVNGNSQRADLALFNRDGKACLILECKAPEVAISEKTLRQILRYNMPLNAQFLILSNGNNHFGLRINSDGSLTPLEQVPQVEQLS